MLQEMTSRYVSARLLSFAGSVQDSKQAEFDISAIELQAQQLGLSAQLRRAVFAQMYGVRV